TSARTFTTAAACTRRSPIGRRQSLKQTCRRRRLPDSRPRWRFQQPVPNFRVSLQGGSPVKPLLDSEAAELAVLRNHNFSLLIMSHPPSFDQRRRPDALRTAMAIAFFCPTSTTNRLPRVTPV